MNINNNRTDTTEDKCCLDLCTTDIEGVNEQVNINYKSNNQTLSSSSSLYIQKSRREFTRRTSNFVVN